MAATVISIHHHPELGMSTPSPRRIFIPSTSILQGQFISTKKQGLDQGGANSKMNFLCRTRGRCLLVQELASPPYNSPGVPVADGMDPPMSTLPTLPTDPESPPPAPRTNPSTLLTPSHVPSSGGAPGGGSMVSKGSNMAGKVGISAGVGVTGILLLIVALLYYFKPDIFMCCKTCVRVQVFHHNHPTQK